MHRTGDEWLRSVAGWRPGRPLPLLECRQLDAYGELVRDLTGGPLPAAGPVGCAGRVVSTGAEWVGGLGRVYAGLTGRPHEHLPPERLLAALDGPGPVAVVALAEDVAELPAAPATRSPLGGMLAGRSRAGLTTLLYRTLTAAALPARRDFLVAHPAMPEADEADATEREDLAELDAAPAGLLTMRVHGCDCSVQLPDAVVCGRSDGAGPVSPLPLARRLTPCLRGDGCIRTDLPASARVPADSLRAGVVLLDTCFAVTPGASAYPPSVSLGLAFLDGHACAVIGGVGLHTSHPQARRTAAELLGAGATVGEVTEALSRQARATVGGAGGFGLLGDPELGVRAGRIGLGVAGARRRGPAAAAAGPPTGFPTGREDLVAALRRLRATLDRICALDRLGVGVPTDVAEHGRAEVRVAAERVCRDLAGCERDVDAAEQTVARLARDVVAGELARVSTTWWDFTDGFFATLREVSRADTGCAACGAVAQVTRFEHRIAPATLLRLTDCGRCGSWSWSDQPAGTLELPPAADRAADRGRPLAVRQRIGNRTGGPVRGQLGFGFVMASVSGLPAPEPPVPVDVTGAELAVGLPAGRIGPDVIANVHQGVVIGLLEGHLLATAVGVVPGPEGRGDAGR